MTACDCDIGWVVAIVLPVVGLLVEGLRILG